MSTSDPNQPPQIVFSSDEDLSDTTTEDDMPVLSHLEKLAASSDSTQAPSVAKSEEVVEVAKNIEPSVEKVNERIDEDVTVKGVKLGEQVDWPHQRADCLKAKPFQYTVVKNRVMPNNEDICDNCFCFVCDVKASACNYWTNDQCRHCNAFPKPSKPVPSLSDKILQHGCWTALRQAVKRRDHPEHHSGWGEGTTSSAQQHQEPRPSEYISMFQEEINEKNRRRDEERERIQSSGWGSPKASTPYVTPLQAVPVELGGDDWQGDPDDGAHRYTPPPSSPKRARWGSGVTGWNSSVRTPHVESTSTDDVICLDSPPFRSAPAWRQSPPRPPPRPPQRGRRGGTRGAHGLNRQQSQAEATVQDVPRVPDCFSWGVTKSREIRQPEFEHSPPRSQRQRHYSSDEHQGPLIKRHNDVYPTRDNNYGGDTPLGQIPQRGVAHRRGHTRRGYEENRRYNRQDEHNDYSQHADDQRQHSHNYNNHYASERNRNRSHSNEYNNDYNAYHHGHHENNKNHANDYRGEDRQYYQNGQNNQSRKRSRDQWHHNQDNQTNHTFHPRGVGRGHRHHNNRSRGSNIRLDSRR